MKANLYYILFLVCFCFSLQAFAQVPNGGFETWTTDGNNDFNPDDWETTNSFPLVSVEQYTPAYAGNYSMRVKAFDASGFIFAGIAYTIFSMNARPTHMRVCVKCNVMPGDQVLIMFGATNGDSVVAAIDSCTFKFDSTVTNFTCYELPIHYVSQLNPDSITIMVSAGNLSQATLGTEVMIDEISFLGVGVDENELNSSVIQAFPNPATKDLMLNLSLQKSSELVVHVVDLAGKEVLTFKTEKLAAGKQMIPIDIDGLPEAIYNCRVEGDGFTGSCRFTKINR